MKMRLSLVVALCLCSSLVFAAAIKGVNGELTLVEKDASNAGKKSDIKVKVGGKIEITWTYPVVPGGPPTDVGSQSDKAAIVKPGEILDIVKPGIVGAGVVGAFFTAESAGKTTIYFNINNGDGKGERLACDVEVAK